MAAECREGVSDKNELYFERGNVADGVKNKSEKVDSIIFMRSCFTFDYFVNIIA